MPHNFANGDIIEAGPINEMDQQIQTNETNIGAKLNKSDVYNGLDYTDEGKALDARQGKALSQAVGGKIDSTEKGAANGIAELGSDGKVPSSQLPSYVDDVLEFASISVFPLTGESGKIYIALDTNKTYRWSGSTYVPVGNDLALGETSSTAYRGDRGKIAYNHATDNGRMTTAQASGLYKIATTEEGHVASVMAVAKSDITALGIPGQDTTYSDMTGATPSTAGTAGLVPAPAAGDQGKALFGDGTWKQVADPADFTGATSSTAGAHGLVPAPAAGDQAKALFGDGSWKNVAPPADFTGATSSTDGAHGLVPAPEAGEQDMVLTGGGTWEESPGAKLVKIETTMTSETGAYSVTVQNSLVTAGMEAVRLYLSDRTAFLDEISVTTSAGAVTIACDDVDGSSDIVVLLQKVITDPTAITTTEFDVLDNRIGDLSDLETTDQTSMVNAVNEVVGSVSSNTQAIANLANSFTPVKITPTARENVSLIDHCVYTVGNMAFVNVSFSLSSAPTSLQLFVSNLPKPKNNVPIVAHKNLGGGNYQGFLTTTGDIRNDYDGFVNGGKYFVSCSYVI